MILNYHDACFSTLLILALSAIRLIREMSNLKDGVYVETLKMKIILQHDLALVWETRWPNYLCAGRLSVLCF